MCALLKTVGPIRSYVAGAADHNTELVCGTLYETEFYELPRTYGPFYQC
jgi:hypothetical protein